MRIYKLVSVSSNPFRQPTMPYAFFLSGLGGYVFGCFPKVYSLLGIAERRKALEMARSPQSCAISVEGRYGLLQGLNLRNLDRVESKMDIKELGTSERISKEDAEKRAALKRFECQPSVINADNFFREFPVIAGEYTSDVPTTGVPETHPAAWVSHLDFFDREVTGIDFRWFPNLDSVDFATSFLQMCGGRVPVIGHDDGKNTVTFSPVVDIYPLYEGSSPKGLSAEQFNSLPTTLSSVNLTGQSVRGFDFQRLKNLKEIRLDRVSHLTSCHFNTLPRTVAILGVYGLDVAHFDFERLSKLSRVYILPEGKSFFALARRWSASQALVSETELINQFRLRNIEVV